MIIDFWEWLSGSPRVENPGYKRVINQWLFFHLFVAFTLTLLTSGPISDIAKILIIPLSGSLIGITFAWSGNISSLLMSKELSDLTTEDEEKFYDFVYTFQLAALVIIVSTCLWAINALGFVDKANPTIKIITLLILYTATSCAIREGWNVIIGVSSLTIVRFKVRRMNEEHKKPPVKDAVHFKERNHPQKHKAS